ncbi:hypothetical protein L2E82_22284 [Cichorium intybus]|uniref:Uncharacterized protein n=1 Tax=Cichorium intybus TaxID=13427 RepID=A0ACB9DXQ7_CICIN|nr:hypothetical protein L2E82_22284 [Cichorium intybus]
MKGNQKENKNSSQSKSQPFKDKGVRDLNVSFADIVRGEKRETHVGERCMKEEEMNEKQSESFEAKKSHFKKVSITSTETQERTVELRGKLIGEIKCFCYLDSIANLCLCEGFGDGIIKYLRGSWVLLDAMNKEEEDRLMGSHEIQKCFKSFKRWDDSFFSCGESSVKVRVKEIEGRVFQPSSVWEDKGNQGIQDEEEEEGDGDSVEDDEEEDVGSTQLENLNEKTNEKIKEDFKFKNKENQKEDISVEDPAQEAERGSPKVHDGNSIKIPNTNSPVCKVQLEPVDVQRNDSPINLNGIFEKLKTLLSRNTPIKEKLEGVNSKNSQSQLIRNHSRSIDEDEQKLGWFEQRITRSQSKKKVLYSIGAGIEFNGDESSGSSAPSVNVAHKLEEVGRECEETSN